MATHEDQWFEIWYAEGVDIAPSHLLVVTPNPTEPKRIRIIDHVDGEKIVYEGKDYEDARSWLLEDEYSLARGREFPDDGW